MRDRIMDDAVEDYENILPADAVFHLVNRWRMFVKYNCCHTWQENMYAFLDFAAQNGYRAGYFILRENLNEPFSPENCYFGKTRNAPPPDTAEAQVETFADRWNRCVFQYNRTRLSAFRGASQTRELGETRDAECHWCLARVCTNEKSPINGTFCPFEKHQYLCRLNNKSEETNAECNHD